MGSDYLSRDRDRINQLQRERRSTCRRIDYYASPEAQAAIETRRAREHPGGVHATNSAVLDAIVCEWARLTGINNQKESEPMTPASDAGVIGRIARAYDFGASGRDAGGSASIENNAEQSRARVVCGARKHGDGQPCQALSVPGKQRCKWHGGHSTGPTSQAGKARAIANLRGHRKPDGNS